MLKTGVAMKTAFSLILIACMLGLQGCASSSNALVGKARPALSPGDVKLYLRPPAKYEEIAMLEASSFMAMAITDQGKMDAVIERMKEDAAKLGANGILVMTTGDKSAGYGGTVITTGKTSYFAGGSSNFKNGTGVAIFVTAE